MSVSVIVAALVVAGTLVPASAFHNDQGHSDKPSVGDCKKVIPDKEFCQSPENKDRFREDRKRGFEEPPPET